MRLSSDFERKTPGERSRFIGRKYEMLHINSLTSVRTAGVSSSARALSEKARAFLCKYAQFFRDNRIARFYLSALRKRGGE